MKCFRISAMKTLLIALSLAVAFAEEAPKPKEPAPQLTADQTVAYYKALSELQAKQIASLKAQLEELKAQADPTLMNAATFLVNICGERGTVPDAKLGVACGEVKTEGKPK